MSYDRYWITLCAGVSATALMASEASAATAQQEPAPAAGRSAPVTELEDVVVTARKREERLQDVPQTVTAISARDLTEVGIRRIDDIQMKVTNLNLAKTQTNTINAVIRGVGSYRNVNGVGFFFDDIQDFSAFSQRLFDVDHVEVLKGPQATLYGGLNIGGAIKYVLKRPEFAWGGEFEAIGGDHGLASAAAAVTGPVSDDVAFRLSAYSEHRDGQMFNVFNNSRIGDSKDYGGRFGLLADLDNLQIYFQVRANEFWTERQQLLTNSPTPDDVNYIVYAQDAVYGQFRTVAPSLRIDYSLGDFTLTSLTGYTSLVSRFVADSQNVPAPAGSNLPYLPLVYANRANTDDSFQQEIRLQSPTDKRLTFLVGAYYLRRTFEMDSETRLVSPPPTFSTLLTILNESQYLIEQYAGFGSATYRLTDQLEATVGIRFNHSKNTFVEYLANQTIVVDRTRVIVPANTPLEASEDDFLPRLELTYRLNPDVMFYGSVSQGVTPAGVAVATSTAAQPFGREKTTAFEAGFKSDLMDNRLRLNAALFYTKYKSRTFTQAITLPNGPPIRLNSNIGDATNIGAEAEFAAKLSPELTVSGGAAYIKSTWDDGTPYTFLDLTLPPAQQVPITVDLGGRNSPVTPRWTANGSVDWVHPIADEVALKARLDVAYVGRQYWDLINTFSSDPYAVVNVLVGVDYKNWSLFAQVRNATQTEYNLDWLPRRDSGGAANLANPGDKRTFLVTLTGKF